MKCVSCDICVYHLGLFVFFPGVFLSSRVTACPVTTDLIMRVYVRTTTTTTTQQKCVFRRQIVVHRRLTPDYLFVSGVGMKCVSCDICVYHLGLFVFFPGVYLSSRVTGACPVTTNLIMRVYVRTTTTTQQKCVFRREIVVFPGRISISFGSSALPMAPVPLCDHAL